MRVACTLVTTRTRTCRDERQRRSQELFYGNKVVRFAPPLRGDNMRSQQAAVLASLLLQYN